MFLCVLLYLHNILLQISTVQICKKIENLFIKIIIK